MSPLALLHCNAGHHYGMGHLMRALAIAEAATQQGFDVTIAGDIDHQGTTLAQQLMPQITITTIPRHLQATMLQEQINAETPQVLHLDSYWPEADQLRLPTGLISNMQDAEFGRRPADLVIDANLGAERWYEPQAEHQAAIIGATATIVRTQVLRQRNHRPEPAETRSIAVVLGGTDPHGLTTKVVAALSDTLSQRQITVIAPPGQRAALEDLRARSDAEIELYDFAEDLPALVRRHDLVISAAGTSVWDFACMGMPMALVCVTENQRRGYRAALEANIAVGLGEPEHEDLATRVGALKPLLEDPGELAALGERARQAIDGRGAWRVVASWRQLMETPIKPTPQHQLTSRAATMEDAELLLQWRNDLQTRQASRSQEAVPWQTHIEWLGKVLRAQDRKLYVIERAGEAVGTVRWDHNGAMEWEVSITVSPQVRGQGLARVILAAGETALRTEGPARLLAAIHADNAASRALFARAGYLPHLPEDDRGFATFAKVRPQAPADAR